MQRLRASFQRARQAGFSERFYDHLLRSDASIRQKFEGTDFRAQNEKLIHGVLAALALGEGRETGKLAFKRLRESHGARGHGVTMAMYRTWLHVFLVTLEELDAEYSDELGRAWEALFVEVFEALSDESGATKRALR